MEAVLHRYYSIQYNNDSDAHITKKQTKSFRVTERTALIKTATV